MSDAKKTEGKSKGKSKAKPKAPKAKPEKVILEKPKGFNSAEAKERVALAMKTLVAKFPKMTNAERGVYLMEVGANRYNALTAYAKG